MTAARDAGGLVAGWLLRGTLHLVHRDDYAWLHALCAPRQAAMSRRRLGQEGVTPDDAARAVELIGGAVGEEGPLTRAELGERLAGAGLPTAGQALPHLLLRAALDGVVLHGPLKDGTPAFAAVADWLGEPPAVDRDRALAELGRRYLAAHAPAGPEDLAAWSGLPLGEARRALEGASVPEEETEAPGVRLLPAFDEWLLGWKDRAFALPGELRKQVHPGGGILRPTVTREGLVVGTWRAERKGDRLRIDTDVDVPEAEREDVARFEGRRLA